MHFYNAAPNKTNNNNNNKQISTTYKKTMPVLDWAAARDGRFNAGASSIVAYYTMKECFMLSLSQSDQKIIEMGREGIVAMDAYTER